MIQQQCPAMLFGVPDERAKLSWRIQIKSGAKVEFAPCEKQLSCPIWS